MRRVSGDRVDWLAARRAVLHRATLRTALMTALVVGAILNVVNYGELLLHSSTIEPVRVAMNFAVPFCVSLWSGVAATSRQRAEGQTHSKQDSGD